MKFLLSIFSICYVFAGMNQVHIVLVEICGIFHEFLQAQAAFSAGKLAYWNVS